MLGQIQQKFTHAFVVTFCGTIIASACGPQLGTLGGSSSNDDKVETVVEENQPVTIDSEKVDVAIPAGTLGVDSTVTADTTSTPEEFQRVAELAPAGSEAVLVEATDASGNAINQVSQPMQIGIQLDGFGLVQQDLSLLCVVVKTNGGELYVWRRSNVSVDESVGIATVSSYFFGTFQAIYCGEQELEGYKDSSQQVTDAGGETTSITATLPASFSGLSYGKVCASMIRFEERPGEDHCAGQPEDQCDTGDTFVGSTEIAASGDTSITLTFAPTEVIDGQEHYLAMWLVDAAATCPNLAYSSVADLQMDAAAFFGWLLDPAAVRAGLTGVVGEAGGPFATMNKTYKLRTEPEADGTTYTPFASSMCIDASLDSGKTMVAVTIGADGTLNGQAELSMPVAYSGSTDGFETRMLLGQRCLDLREEINNPVPATGYPALLLGPESDISATVELAPITLSITNPAFALLSGRTACFRAYSAGTDQTNDVDAGLLTANLELGAGKTYQTLLPYLTTPQDGDGRPLYDMYINVMDGDDYCSQPDDSGYGENPLLPSVPSTNKPLNPDIEI